MLRWWQSRAWRRQADEALAAAHLVGERQRLASELVARVAGESRQSAAAGSSAATPEIVQAAVLALLNDDVVGLSLGLRYLQGMQDRIHHGNYEDVHRLRAEMLWVRGYIAARFRSALLIAEETASAGRHSDPGEPLRAALTAQVLSHLRSSAVAA